MLNLLITGSTSDFDPSYGGYEWTLENYKLIGLIKGNEFMGVLGSKTPKIAGKLEDYGSRNINLRFEQKENDLEMG